MMTIACDATSCLTYEILLSTQHVPSQLSLAALNCVPYTTRYVGSGACGRCLVSDAVRMDLDSVRLWEVSPCSDCADHASKK